MSGSEPRAAAAEIQRLGPPGFRPEFGLILGSGLGALADRIEDAVVIPVGQIPGFPTPRVEGHAGRLVLGRLGGRDVACLQGRVHAYEGQGFAGMATVVRAFKAIGCQGMLATCAAGSLRPEVGPGRLMVLADHINLLGTNPLVGPNDEAIGPRFPNLLDAWDAGFRRRLLAVGARQGATLAQGVYAACLGPSFETPAEIRMLKLLGADAVGMSMVPECILARHAGLKMAGVAVITNLAVGLGEEPVTHAQTLAVAGLAAQTLERLVVGFLEDTAPEDAAPAKEETP